MRQAEILTGLISFLIPLKGAACALIVIRPRCFPVEPKKPKLESNDPRGGRVGSARSLPVPQTDGVVAFPDDGHRAKLVSGTFLHGHNLRSRRIWIESIYFIFPVLKGHRPSFLFLPFSLQRSRRLRRPWPPNLRAWILSGALSTTLKSEGFPRLHPDIDDTHFFAGHMSSISLLAFHGIPSLRQARGRDCPC
jgi:hypothetical protein